MSSSSQGYRLDHQGWWVSPEDELLLPQSLQWKVLKILKQTYHLGVENTLSLLKCMFEGVKIRETLQDIIRECKICQHNNPYNQHLSFVRTQKQGSDPGEDWQIDFTHMPGSPHSCFLLVLVNTFMSKLRLFLIHRKDPGSGQVSN
jgi:hypothetical protein